MEPTRKKEIEPLEKGERKNGFKNKLHRGDQNYERGSNGKNCHPSGPISTRRRKGGRGCPTGGANKKGVNSPRKQPCTDRLVSWGKKRFRAAGGKIFG